MRMVNFQGKTMLGVKVSEYFGLQLMRNGQRRPLCHLRTANAQMGMYILYSTTYTTVSVHSVSGQRKLKAQADKGLRCTLIA